MAFDPAHPIHSGLPESDPVRENFVQLAVHHKSDTEPPAKAEGFIWWDTSEPANQKLRAYTGGGWVDLFDHMESTPASPLAGAVSWQEFVKDKDLTDPPGSPSMGDRYIVAAVATGDWVGEENNIAEWDGSAWIFTVSEGGWVTWVEDETEIYVFNGASWVQESFGPHAASHTDGSDQLPNTNAGDVLIHNGSVWEDKQLAVKQSEYLVGPVGTAKYTLIQAAIDQAVIDGYDEANPTTVWILPGTYTEALSLKPGIYLSAVVDPLARGYKPEVTVTIVGVATFNYVDAGATYYPMELRGIKIEPTTGSPLVLAGSARKTVKMWSTWLETADADVIVFGTSPVESVEAYKSFIITTDGTKYVSQIGSGDSVTLVKSLASAVITSDMFQLDGTGRLYIYGNQISDSGSLTGCINVLATATSARLYIEEVVLFVDAARNHIQVDGSLLTGGLVRWHAIFNVNDENGDRLKIGGTNAADLLSLDRVEKHDYLVGPAGTARYSSIQSAIDQAVADGAENLAPVDIDILPGTYTEDLTLYEGVSLRSVVRHKQMFGGTPLTLGKFVASIVKVVGEHTFAKDSGGADEHTVTVDEIWFVTTEGGALFAFSGTANKRLWLQYCYLDADPGTVLTFSGSGICVIETDHSLLYGTETIDIGSDVRMVAKSTFIWEDSRGVAIRLHDGGRFTSQGYFGPGQMEGRIYGSIEVSAGTGSYLIVANTAFFQASGDAIVVNGQLNAASWFRDITDISAQKAVVSGTYVDQFKEYPLGANAGDILESDGSQWQISPANVKTIDHTWEGDDVNNRVLDLGDDYDFILVFLEESKPPTVHHFALAYVFRTCYGAFNNSSQAPGIVQHRAMADADYYIQGKMTGEDINKLKLGTMGQELGGCNATGLTYRLIGFKFGSMV